MSASSTPPPERRPGGARERYLQSAGDAVRLGLAHVQLGEPGWSFADLVESDRTSRIDTLRPARVDSVEEFGRWGATPTGRSSRPSTARSGPRAPARR